MNLQPILDIVLADYLLPLDGIHGLAHWARVFENGLRLATLTGANVDIVTLFAVLHDSRRRNESHDPQHGPRAAELALQLQGKQFNLDDTDLHILYVACHGHTHERTHQDVTIQTCWDADRLDLARVGIIPRPERLCTDAAQSVEILQWANKRAITNEIPGIVNDWGIGKVT